MAIKQPMWTGFELIVVLLFVILLAHPDPRHDPIVPVENTFPTRFLGGVAR